MGSETEAQDVNVISDELANEDNQTTEHTQSTDDRIAAEMAGVQPSETVLRRSTRVRTKPLRFREGI